MEPIQTSTTQYPSEEIKQEKIKKNEIPFSSYLFPNCFWILVCLFRSFPYLCCLFIILPNDFSLA